MDTLILEQNQTKINAPGASLRGKLNDVVGQWQDSESLGLSMAHNPRKPTGEMVLYRGGAQVRVAKPKKHQKQYGGGKRGQIKEFSKASRRRLLQMLTQTQKSAKPIFITLTYPGEYPQDPKLWKQHLEKFVKNLLYRYPDLGAVWKLEPQRRGAPHYHLLVWGPNYNDLKACVSLLWFRAVDSGDLRHLRAGTQVSRIRSWRGVMAYAGKYLGKVVDTCGWDSPGRFWGVISRKNVPWAEAQIIEISERQAIELMRYLRRYAKLRSRQYRSLTVFVNAPDQWERLIM